MLNMEFRFPAGRYHATPWDRQVNEGFVEWPPQPWRLVRALDAVYHLKTDQGKDAILESLLKKLSDPPVYQLPRATMGHTRHYMPLYKIGSSSKIFDTFVAVERDKHLLVSWKDVELDNDERRLLEELLERMTYLGRAESWVVATLFDGVVLPNCTPMEQWTGTGDTELLNVLVPMNEEEFKDWKTSSLEKADRKEKKKLGKVNSFMDAIRIETTVLKKDGWSQPPGSKWIQYARRTDCFDVTSVNTTKRSNNDLPTIARYAVASAAPPRLTDAISVAERVHTSLVSFHQGPVFTGCDEDRKPLSGHGHAYVLSESNVAFGKGQRGDLTHITLYAPMGFDPQARNALGRLRKVWGYGGHDIQLVLLGVGVPEDLGGTDVLKGESPILASSRVWISRTPFVPTRHPKFTRAGRPKLENGLVKGSPEHDLRRLIGEAGFPEPVSVVSLKDTMLAGHRTSWLEFRKDRKKGNGRKGSNLGYGFKIVFPEEVAGPIALGYGAHFGLGCFVPADDEHGA